MGELINEMIFIAVTDPKVLRERNKVPEGSRNYYETFCAIREEISRREKEYHSALTRYEEVANEHANEHIRYA